MSFSQRRRGFRGRRRSNLGSIVNSIKNELNIVSGIAASTNNAQDIAKAVDNPVTANVGEVKIGSIIKAIWIEFWYYGLSAGNTNDIIDIYLIKNPGANLTNPNPGTTGTSNEKKFIIREWKGLAGNKSLGGTAYSQPGRWFKLPKRYQRMGTDDRWQLVARSATTGNFCQKFIYKWYS